MDWPAVEPGSCRSVCLLQSSFEGQVAQYCGSGVAPGVQKISCMVEFIFESTKLVYAKWAHTRAQYSLPE